MIVFQTVAVALAMFSALPVPQFDWNEKNMRYALCAFPLVGVICGALWCLCGALPLPDATKVLPGHEDFTTLGQERRSNPYMNEAWF